nr:hypothetical protein [uncultured Devosia sp.]
MESHVLPAFVFRWLRGRSGTGHIRHTDNPNRRVQDGLKFHWLCGKCEARFSSLETAFATRVFYPWQGGDNHIAYREWLLKFCASVSWRVLKFARGRNENANYTPEQDELMNLAEAKWHDFLTDKAPHPGQFEQHLLILDVIEETTLHDLPTNINRFMTGAITLDIVGSDRSLMTYAKLGRFSIFGMIQKGQNEWLGTKVHVKHGILKPGTFTVPAGLVDLFREKAAGTADAMKRMSPAQQAKVAKYVEDNPTKFAASEQFAAIAADVRMFGRSAALKK